MLKTFLKGMAMGAADIVPGVSGGTIALLTGIYERLINAIKSVGLDTLKTWKENGLTAAWQQIDGTFLLALVSGIGTSILVFSRVIHYLLEHFPVLIWSGFFGLVLASVWFVTRQMSAWNGKRVLSFILGLIVAAAVSLSSTAQLEANNLTLFLCGALAICAMILPGISGSFIMLLLGMYSTIIAAIKGFDFAVLGVFAVGCVVGIMLFSRLLSWVLSRYHDATMALLAGFMAGALIKVWPWKEVISYRLNSKGESVPFLDAPIWPWAHAEPYTIWALLLMILSCAAVVYMERRADLSEK